MEQETHNNQYCQSCGMPLRFDVEEYLGTNTDQSRSHEYCYYCLKDGEYTVDIPIQQMVDIWVKYTDKYNEYSDTDYSPHDLRILLNKRLPTLKRWQQKQVTREVHYEAVNKIKAYIDEHLNAPIDIDELCRIANLSFYYLRRIFKEITGENVGSYIQRLRLDYIAHKLISTPLSVQEVLEQTTYQTRSSLAKAFRKQFGISMSDYRERYRQISMTEDGIQAFSELQPHVKKLNSVKTICFPVEGNYRSKANYPEAWKKIIHYKERHLVGSYAGNYLSISQDNPQVTAQQQCRFYLGVLINGEHKPHGEYRMLEIPSGLYAVFTHKGDYAALPELYRSIYEEWLPQSKYAQSNSLSFEIYRNTPTEAIVSQLVTDVYIPIEKLK